MKAFDVLSTLTKRTINSPWSEFFLLIEISVIFGGPLYEKEKKGVETPDLIIKLDHKSLLMYSY